MSIYSAATRDFLSQFIEIKKNQNNFIYTSTIPFGIVCIFCCIYPKITDIFNFFSFSVYNFNGYVIPFLFAYVVNKRYLKKNIYNIYYFFILGCLAIIFLGSVIGYIYYGIKDLTKKPEK